MSVIREEENVEKNEEIKTENDAEKEIKSPELSEEPLKDVIKPKLYDRENDSDDEVPENEPLQPDRIVCLVNRYCIGDTQLT